MTDSILHGATSVAFGARALLLGIAFLAAAALRFAGIVNIAR